MDVFLKAAAGTLIALILYLILMKTGKEFSLLLTVAVVCMMAGITVVFLQPVIEFIQKLIAVGQFDSDMLEIVLKAVGIGLLAEITGLICTDAGNASLGKILQILASVVILWLSIPLFTSLIDLVEDILVTA